MKCYKNFVVEAYDYGIEGGTNITDSFSYMMTTTFDKHVQSNE